MGQKIAIVDYGLGNIASIKNAFLYHGVDPVVTSSPFQIKSADKLILPGVGAFQPAITRLKKTGLYDAIVEKVTEGTFILGICLGMQLLFTVSYENGVHNGFNFIEGEVVRFQNVSKIPHMGWNSVEIVGKSRLFEGIRDGEFFYFVHSYYCKPEKNEDIAAISEYGGSFCAAVKKGNVFGVQFHPEKSHCPGLKVLENFIKL